MPEGRQSPDPETQSGAQKDAPASGQGTDNAENKQQDNKESLDKLASNPKGPLDDALEDKFAKKA